MGVPRYMVALSLQWWSPSVWCASSAKTVPQPHTPTPHEHEWLALRAGRHGRQRSYKRGTGCAHCGGTGYSGRTGVYENARNDQRIVEAINTTTPGVFVQAARKQMAGETLRRDAVRLVVKGRRRSKKPCASAISLRINHAHLRLQSTQHRQRTRRGRAGGR
jgi:MSHA biogenesis protein MshE